MGRRITRNSHHSHQKDHSDITYMLDVWKLIKAIYSLEYRISVVLTAPSYHSPYHRNDETTSKIHRARLSIYTPYSSIWYPSHHLLCHWDSETYLVLGILRQAKNVGSRTLSSIHSSTLTRPCVVQQKKKRAVSRHCTLVSMSAQSFHGVSRTEPL